MADSITRRRFLWDWIDEHHPEVWDGELTPAVVTQATKALIDGLSLGTRRYSVTRAAVKRWLENPSWHSPYIDDVAIDRALDFDWSAIDGLTHAERSVFYDRLAGMDDPFEDEPEDVALWRRLVNAGPHPEANPSPRRLRLGERGMTDAQTIRLALRRRAAA